MRGSSCCLKMLENLIGSMLADKSINGEPMSVNSGWVSEFMSTFSEVSQTSKSNFMGPADSLYSLCEPFFFAFHNGIISIRIFNMYHVTKIIFNSRAKKDMLSIRRRKC